MNNETIERIQQIRERLAKATPGPWKMAEPRELEDCPIDHGWTHEPCNDIESETATWVPTWAPASGPYPESVISSWGHDADGVSAKLADLQFIANAPSDIEYLLAALSEMRTIALREAAEIAQNYPGEIHGKKFIAAAILGRIDK